MGAFAGSDTESETAFAAADDFFVLAIFLLAINDSKKEGVGLSVVFIIRLCLLTLSNKEGCLFA